MWYWKWKETKTVSVESNKLIYKYIYIYIKPLQLAKHLWMIPSAARTLGGPRSHHVSADICHVCLRVPQGSVLGPLRILVSTLSTTFRTRNTTSNSKQTYPYTDVWKGKWTQESLTRLIKTLWPTSRQQTTSVENSWDLDARMLFCFVFYVCVRAFFFYFVTMSKGKDNNVPVIVHPSRERELSCVFDHVLSGGK